MLVAALKAMAAEHSDLAPTIEEGEAPGERWVRVLFVGDEAAANAALWTRPHVGGLVDFEVVTAAGTQVFARHLQGPTRDQLADAWHAMMLAFIAVSRRAEVACTHCGFSMSCAHAVEHPSLCCDCFDLANGMPLEAIDAERVAAGRPPIARPWPSPR